MQISVTENTQELLARRVDDFRIAMIYDVMYGDDFNGLYPDRKFTFRNQKNEEKEVILRKARPLDSIQYEKVPSSAVIAQAIEGNLANLQSIKRNGTVKGQMPIKDIWVIVITADKDGTNARINAYYNPDSSDCNDIIHSNRMIIIAGFIITYDTHIDKSVPLPEGCPEEVNEYTFISPLDSTLLSEYNEFAKEQEAKMLENMFLIHFDKGSIKR